MKLSESSRKLLRATWLFVLAVVVAGSLLPSWAVPAELLNGVPVSDKLLHFLAYALLAFLPALHESRRALLAVVAAGLLLGVVLEFAQAAVGRYFEPGDILANITGLAAGLLLGLWVRAPRGSPAAGRKA